MTDPITITNPAALEQGQRVARELPPKVYVARCRQCGNISGGACVDGSDAEDVGMIAMSAMKLGYEFALVDGPVRIAPACECKSTFPREVSPAEPFAISAATLCELRRNVVQDTTDNMVIQAVRDRKQLLQERSELREKLDLAEKMTATLPAAKESNCLSPEIPPHIQYLRQLPAAKAGQAIEEAAADRIRELEAENARLSEQAKERLGFLDEISEHVKQILSHHPPLEMLPVVVRKMAESHKRLTAELAALAERERGLRGALEFYADEEHYDDNGSPGIFVCAGGDYGGKDEWQEDRGAIARAALSPAVAAAHAHLLPMEAELKGIRQMESRPKPGLVNQAGTCDACGGPITHRPGKPGEFDHECRPTRSIYSPLCGGCGVALQPENAWMEDGCPCNTPKGCNDGNQLISGWRQESQQRADVELTKLQERLAEVERQRDEAKRLYKLAWEELVSRGKELATARAEAEAAKGKIAKLADLWIAANEATRLIGKAGFEAERCATAVRAFFDEFSIEINERAATPSPERPAT